MNGEEGICNAELHFFILFSFRSESTILTVGQWISRGAAFLPTAGPNTTVQLAFQAHPKHP